MVSARSGFHPTMPKACDTMRLPGFSSLRKRGCSLSMRKGSRYTVTTLAWEMSVASTSPSMNETRSVTPA